MQILLGGGGGGAWSPPQFGERGVAEWGSKGHTLISSMQISENFGSNLLMGWGRGQGCTRTADNHRRSPPPPPLWTLSAQISATTKRGCRPWAGSPWGPGNRGADLLLPLPPPTEMGPDRKRAQHTPPPPHALAPSHSLQAVTWGSRSLPTWTGSRRRTTSMLGSGTRMVTQQVVLLSQTSEQVDPSTTTPPPPPAPPTGGVHGVGALRAQKVEAVHGSQLDRCGYPLSGLPREPPGVRVPLQLHRRRPGQHSPVHSSSVVGDPWRPDSHLPTPAPPPLPYGAVTRVVCPLGPPVYAGSSTATQAPSPGRLQGRAALGAPWSPSPCRPSTPWAEGPVHDNTTSA